MAVDRPDLAARVTGGEEVVVDVLASKSGDTVLEAYVKDERVIFEDVVIAVAMF